MTTQLERAELAQRFAGEIYEKCSEYGHALGVLTSTLIALEEVLDDAAVFEGLLEDLQEKIDQRLSSGGW